MSTVLPFSRTSDTPSSDAANLRAEKISDAIKTLLSMLTLAEQHQVLQKITEAVQPIPAPRAGDVLGAVVRWIPRDSKWTVEDAKQGVAAQGVAATPKEIYNAIGYLTRKQHIRRIGYGRYLIDGAEIRTLDDFGLEPAPDDCE
jgi:hypothetical protein